MDWLEWIGSGVEMAWESLRHYHAIHWSPAILLDATVEVLVAFLVLVCMVLNFFTSSFIRVSGFHIPCSCCVHFRKESSVLEVQPSQNPSFLPTLKSIGAAVESKLRLSSIDLSKEYFRDGEFKSTNTSPACTSRDWIPRELEILPERDEADFEYTSVLRCEKVNKDLKEDVNWEQYVKVQELLRALQSERETMAALYSELEEERNSSATAASEALAMISRLQEEKAAIQMEAWQFQRMVMEKAMYDQEAIEVLKEILAKQEEERLDLEEEVRLYKERLDEVLTEERDYAGRIGSDYVPTQLQEGTSTERNSISPKSERAELLLSEKITPSGRISKDERITPNARISKEERITPDGRLVKEERITPTGRPSKEERITPNGRVEDAEFLDRLSKTKSELLTALLQDGFPEPTSTFVEDSANYSKEINKVRAKIPVRAESLPILDHEQYKDAVGLGLIKTGRDIGLPIPPAVAKKQTEKALGKDAIKSIHEPASVSRELTIPIIAKKKSFNAQVAEDAGKLADEPVFVNRDPTPPTIAEEKTEKARVVKNGGKPDEPVFINRDIGLSVPPAAGKKQTEKAFMAKDAGKFTDKPLIINREVSLPILPPTAVKKPSEKALVKDDGKVSGEPEFVSLKRRWSSRGTQEVSVETLAKAKEDRRMEEKRLSVLEYVRNLEEQLQLQAGRPAIQLARARSVDGREDVKFKSPGQYESSSVSLNSVSSGGSERDESVQRRLFADGYSLAKDLSMNSFRGGDDDKLHARKCNITTGSGGKTNIGEGGSYGKSEESADEALFVHDVYEVQNHPYETPSRLGVRVLGSTSGLELQSLFSERIETSK